jgi:predicted restriction endonuclease
MSAREERRTGKLLNERFKVGAKHALYREDGKWYHKLKGFPGALFDATGYLLFKTEEDFLKCKYLQIQKDVHAAYGISAIPGYTLLPKNANNSENDQRSTNRAKAKKTSRTRSQFRFPEGAVKEMTRELQQRNPKLRAEAIAEYGDSCQVCGFNFGKFYGSLAEGYIEVHHLSPLSAHKVERITTIKDVAVVCANCHRALHRNGRTPIPIEELKKIVRPQDRSTGAA